MSKFKKTVSLFLVLTMVLATCVFSLNAGAEASVEVNEYDYVVSEKLQALEVVDVVDDSRLGEYVLREDIIEVLMKYLLIDGASIEGETTPFIDVSIYDENIGGYRILKQLGYISGGENKMFRPKDYLTYNEAIKLIVSAMGYGPFAKRNGGYPAGYLYTANKYGLLKAVRGSGSNPIPYCDLYRIIEASLYADAVVYRFTADEDDTAFMLDENRTVLEETYGYVYVSGIVTGNEDTKLLSSGSARVSRYQIEIENVPYDTPGKEYANLLGRYVYGYAKDDGNGNLDILYLEADYGRNNEYKVFAEDILTAKTTSTKIYYEDENGKEKFLDVKETGLNVIYNGKADTNYIRLSDMMPTSGHILGVDNTGDRVIDVLFVYDFENIVVDIINPFSYEITDVYNSSDRITLDSDEDEVRIYDENGTQIEFSDIAKGDVLSYMQSNNASGYKLTIVYVGRSSVTGTVTEITDDKFLIDDTYYELAESLKTHIQETRANPVRMGEKSTFYFDYSGKIAYYEREITTDATYGVLAGIHPVDGLKNSIEVILYTQDAEMIETKIDDIVKIDKSKYELNKDSEFNTIKTKLESAIGQVILFKKGSGDRINYVDIPEASGETGDLVKLEETSAQFVIRGGIFNIESPWKQYVSKPGQYILFKTPETANMTTDKENWAVDSKLYDPDVYSAPGDFTNYAVYNLGQDGVPRVTCVLLRGGNSRSASVNSNQPYYVITGTTTGVDEEGNIGTKLYYSKNGTELSSFVTSTVDYGYNSLTGESNFNVVEADKPFAELELGIGDVIQFGTNADGHISAINVIYRNNREQDELNAAVPSIPYNNTGHQAKSGTVAGTVAAIDAENKLISIETVTEESGAKRIQVLNTTTDITFYNIGETRTLGGTLTDIIPGDTIIVRSSGGFSVYSAQFTILR